MLLTTDNFYQLISQRLQHQVKRLQFAIHHESVLGHIDRRGVLVTDLPDKVSCIHRHHRNGGLLVQIPWPVCVNFRRIWFVHCVQMFEADFYYSRCDDEVFFYFLLRWGHLAIIEEIEKCCGLVLLFSIMAGGWMQMYCFTLWLKAPKGK